MTVRSRPHAKTPPAGLPRTLGGHLRSLSDSYSAARRGKMDVTNELTFNAGQPSTTLTDHRLSPQSWVGLMPKTANAATELGAGGVYFEPTDGSCVIYHANNGQTDRTFTVLILG